VKNDYVVILEFEAAVEEGNDRHFRKVGSFSRIELMKGPIIFTEVSTLRY
jgi:hypothetical protein